ncbi:MAG TPA: hypothetical protein VK604_19510 [Bryobacteraceae bacterium]|nr:hypothetical protein [Bryobacteraceae bacterium]
MKSAIITAALMLGASLALPAYAQVKEDVKDAGKDTKDAAVTGAKKTGAGTKKAYKSSTHAVKKGTNKAAAGTAKGANKVVDKTTTSPK